MSSDTPQKSRWTRPLLIGSIVLNLFLIGLIGGHMFMREAGRSDAGRPDNGQRGMRHMSEDLSDSGRATIKQVMDNHAEDIRALWRLLRDQRVILSDQLAADQLDDAAIATTLNEIRRIDSAIQEQFHAATLEIAHQLPAEERRKLNLRWRKTDRDGRHILSLGMARGGGKGDRQDPGCPQPHGMPPDGGHNEHSGEMPPPPPPGP